MIRGLSIGGMEEKFNFQTGSPDVRIKSKKNTNSIVKRISKVDASMASND